MKLLLENWREYLKETENSFPYQIYCDMDGVLVDFLIPTLDQINKDLEDETVTGKKINRLRQELSKLGRDVVTIQDLDKMDKENRLQAARKYMYKRLEDNEEFWATLPWAEGGKELWGYISEFDPYILTAPMKGEGSKRGKEIWIENNLSPPPQKVFMSHDKYNWAVNGGPNVLIDDFITNVVPWREAGGIAIHHTSTANTIKQLKEIQERDE
jgi:hypothetical protein